jgi:hypothetical protein
MNREERTDAMSEAVARVVLHEWVHIAAQSAGHGRDGITKAIFSPNDLLCGDETKKCAGGTKDGPAPCDGVSAIVDSFSGERAGVERAAQTSTK